MHGRIGQLGMVNSRHAERAGRAHTPQHGTGRPVGHRRDRRGRAAPYRHGRRRRAAHARTADPAASHRARSGVRPRIRPAPAARLRGRRMRSRHEGRLQLADLREWVLVRPRHRASLRRARSREGAADRIVAGRHDDRCDLLARRRLLCGRVRSHQRVLLPRRLRGGRRLRRQLRSPRHRAQLRPGRRGHGRSPLRVVRVLPLDGGDRRHQLRGIGVDTRCAGDGHAPRVRHGAHPARGRVRGLLQDARQLRARSRDRPSDRLCPAHVGRRLLRVLVRLLWCDAPARWLFLCSGQRPRRTPPAEGLSQPMRWFCACGGRGRDSRQSWKRASFVRT